MHTFYLIQVNLIFTEKMHVFEVRFMYGMETEVISHPAWKFNELSLIDAWKMKNAGKFKGFPLITCDLIIAIFFGFVLFCFWRIAKNR